MMIRVSTRGRYALRAIIDLALENGPEPVLGQDIAGRQDISADYVAQLFRKLGAAGLVEGVKGPGGGYRLAADPADITAGDVIRAVEGPLAVVYCVDPEDEQHCEREAHCVTHLLWERLSNVMREYLDSVTLQDLCQEAHDLEAPARLRQGNGAGAEPLCTP